jgi:hypothetical protein
VTSGPLQLWCDSYDGVGNLGAIFTDILQFHVEEANDIVERQVALMRQRGASVKDDLTTGVDLIALMPSLRVNSDEFRSHPSRQRLSISFEEGLFHCPVSLRNLVTYTGHLCSCCGTIGHADAVIRWTSATHDVCRTAFAACDAEGSRRRGITQGASHPLAGLGSAREERPLGT